MDAKRDMGHSTNVGIGRWSAENRWRVELDIDHLGNVRSMTVWHCRRDVDPEFWPIHRADVPPFSILREIIGEACIECAAQGVQEPLPGLRLTPDMG